MNLDEFGPKYTYSGENSLLGKGTYGEVHLCRLSKGGSDLYACKIIYVSKPETLKMINTEYEIGRIVGCDHPNLMCLTDRLVNRAKHHVLLVSKYIPDSISLKSWLTQTPSINDRLKVIGDILSGLHQLHKYGIVHGDISMNNVLVCHGLTGVLIDYGLSCYLNPKSDELRQCSDLKAIGTLQYIAPELVLPKSGLPNPSPASDIYSLGVLINQMLTGRDWIYDTPITTPFDLYRIYSNPSAGGSIYLIPADLTPHADTFNRMISKEISARPTTGQLMSILHLERI